MLANPQGREMAIEVMVPNSAIRNLIREDKIHQLYSAMQVGQSKHGMQTMNQALLELYSRRAISLDEALGRCTDPDELRSMLSAAAARTGTLSPTRTGPDYGQTRPRR